jgi:hypothetical protein
MDEWLKGFALGVLVSYDNNAAIVEALDVLRHGVSRGLFRDTDKVIPLIKTLEDRLKA